MNKKRILVTYIESGMGHITSVKSISDSLKSKYSEEFEIIDCQIMKDSEVQQSFEKFLTNQTKFTNKVKAYGFMMFWLIEILGKQNLMKLMNKTLFRKACEATINALGKYEPDVIVCTHYLITYCAIELKKRFMPNLLVVTYNPDNNINPLWDSDDGIFILNNAKALSQAVEKRKFKPENVRQVNFTARKCIVEESGTKNEYREKYNFPADNFTVIVADGAYALGKMKSVVNELLKIKNKKLTIIALAGKNEATYNYFCNKKAPDNITLVPLQFMDAIYEIYKASDIFVTKGGPNAVLDSMFMFTPVIIDYYPHQIEKATKKLFVDELKCGEYIDKPKKIRKRIEEFADDPTLLEQYLVNVHKFNKNANGADQIADIIYEEAYKDGGSNG